MTRHLRALVAAGCLAGLGALGIGAPGIGAIRPALAQKPGGILKIYHRDSPASMSIHEEGTIGVILPMMGVFNNLVVFDQNVPQNSDEVDRPRSGDELDVERRPHRDHLQAARGRQMA